MWSRGIVIMNLISAVIKRPIGVIMIVIAVLILGAISLSNLAVDLYPEMDVPVAAVSTIYEGAAPQEVEQLISMPLEEALSSVENVTSVESVSSANSSLVILQFNWGVDLDVALNDVRDRLDQTIELLPDDAKRPVVLKMDPQQMPIMRVELSGSSPEELQKIAEDDVAPFFERIEGVASVTIEGGREREIKIELDKGKLNHYGLTSAQVVQALNFENKTISSGTVVSGTKDLLIRVDGEYTSLYDIEKTIIPLPTKDFVFLEDIAVVKDTFKEMSVISQVNNNPAVVLSMIKKSEGNTLQIASKLNQAIEQKVSELASDPANEHLSLSVVTDDSKFISKAMGNVKNNMIVGSILAVIILFLFLRSVRPLLVISFSIPIAIVSTFILMYFAGETLNILSMGGLALGIGMIVDNAIVILENIYKKRQEGLPLLKAAYEGTTELSAAIISSTLTTVVVFVPIIFVDGVAAEMFRPLALTVSFALLASLVIALTLIPMLSSRLLGTKVATKEEEESGWFNRSFSMLRKAYLKFLVFALKWRKMVIAATVGLIILSLLLVPFIGTDFIPSLDQGQVSIGMKTESGTTLEETEKMVKQVNEKLGEFSEIIETSYVTIKGSSDGGSGLGSSSTIGATFIVQLVDPSKREIDTQQFLTQLEDKVAQLPGIETVMKELDPSFGDESPVVINVNGPDLPTLMNIGEQVISVVNNVEGTVNVDSSSAESRPEMQILVDRQLASRYGLTYQQVMNEMKIGFDGQVATRYREEGDEYDVRVLLPENQRSTINDLENMVIQSYSGAEIPLTSVATLVQVQGPTDITRKDQQRLVTITSDLRDRDLGSVNGDIQQALTNIDIPEGYDISIGGQGDDMTDSFVQLFYAALLSIFLVYLVMAVQFESLVYPLVIMFALPTTIIGILVGLFLTGEPLSIPAFIGIIMLMGIVVNNAIVLVSYINIKRDEGLSRYEAIIEAGNSRLRPILMTTLTTILAMVPLALGIGQGMEAQRPMAIVIIFGMSFSTLLTLVLIPLMYTFLDDLSNWSQRRFKKDKVLSEENGGHGRVSDTHV